MLHELCRRAGTSYEDHYQQRRKLDRSRQESSSRRCSAVSLGAAWFQKKHFVYRVLFGLHGVSACLYSAPRARECLVGVPETSSTGG